MTNEIEGLKPETEPGVASAEGGLVILDGPDGVAATMTADAAARTGQSLIDAAERASKQLEDDLEDDKG